MVRPTASPGNVSPAPRPAGKVDAPEQQVNLSRGGLHTSPRARGYKSYLYKPLAGIQSGQESPVEDGSVVESGRGQDLSDVGCSTQVIVVHEERHPIIAADGRGEE